MNLKSRLAKLELEQLAQPPQDRLTIFFTRAVAMGEPDLHVIGWKHQDNLIMALPNESQDELQTRAGDIARAESEGVVFLSGIYANDS